MKYLSILMLAILTGCVVLPAEQPAPEPQPSADTIFSPPPQLWSTQKMLSESPEACASEAVEILKALQFVSVVKNGTYVYGNLLSNRAAIKCVPNGEGTFVYTAVAGPEKKQVERLRNEIFWRL